jgi:hypothetical protein
MRQIQPRRNASTSAMPSPPSPPGGARRNFWRSLVAETLGWFEEIQGNPQVRYEDLSDRPDAELRAMRPAVSEHSPYNWDGEKLIMREGDGRVAHVFTGIDLAIFRSFDGSQTLGEIAERVGREHGLAPDVAWYYARTLFIVCTRRGACYAKRDVVADLGG